VEDAMTLIVKIINVGSGKVLDVPGSSLNAGIQIQQFHDNGGGANQQWGLLPDPSGSGAYKIFSVASTLYLEVRGASNVNHAVVQQNTNVQADNQLWIFSFTKPVGNNGVFAISPANAKNKYLDVTAGSKSDNALIQLFDLNGGANQMWHLEVIDLQSDLPGRLSNPCADADLGARRLRPMLVRS
jgi:Ricin-type beta-trefoil lectin domain-like